MDFDNELSEELKEEVVIPNWKELSEIFPTISQDDFSKILAMGWQIKENFDISNWDGE